MAEVSWSEEQLAIIESRKKNLLVSAAAGAGKTTVMIERVIGLITADIDVDSLLIVTFTRDAAANMREKLSTRLSEMIEKDPGNKRLLRQQMLLQNAMITTIDSFCNSVVREFFYRTDIDPAFRIADNAEIALLRKRVMDELLEEEYSSADPDFMLLVESFCGIRNDDKISDLVDSLSKAAYAQAWPKEWLEELRADALEDIGKSELRPAWRARITQLAMRRLTEAAQLSSKAVTAAQNELNRIAGTATAKEEEKIKKAADILISEAGMIDDLRRSSEYGKLRAKIETVSFDRLTLSLFPDEIKDTIKNARDTYKDIITKKIRDKWFSDSEESMAQACSDAAAPMIALVGLTEKYLDKLAAQKKEKNVFEFSDISHFTLEILAGKDADGRIVPTEAALELRNRFHDIFIDEYQDSDAVQEQIAEIIAGAPGASPYTFMVGDVKQSIYKFRMAKPELFIDRAARYTENPADGELIRLGYNYRSSKEVIDSVNDVFRLCMHESFGKVEYDKGAELVKGLAGDSTGTGEDITEILIARAPGNDDPEGEAQEESYEEYTSVQVCAKVTAQRIKKLFDSGYKIRDKKEGLRDIRCGDIVILLRSTSGSDEFYKEELENLGIPAFTDSGSGFLGSYEISVIVNFLRLLDNPYQDIPLASVLRSVIGGLTDDELACVRIFGGFAVPFWQCVKAYAENGTQAAVKDKCAHFLKLYSDIRKMNLTRDLDKIIFSIYERTGFYLYCTALPSGQTRASNLDLLLEYASQFEKSSYSGLFDFVGYIEEITRAKDDLEEAVSAEASDSVRIMTIHKSKGLEFPVVILANALKQFNLQDTTREVIISPDYGIASKCVSLDKRVKYNTVRRMLAADGIETDTIGEELRLLYVAMTRAMQKLIVVGVPGSKGKKEEDYITAAQTAEDRFDDSYIASVRSYMDVLYPAALINEKDFLIEERRVEPEDTEIVKKLRTERRRGLERIGSDPAACKEAPEICELLDYCYEKDPREALPIKLSVSDIKHAGMEEEGVETPWRGSTGRPVRTASETGKGSMGEHTNRDEGEYIGRTAGEYRSPAAGEGFVSRLTGAERGTLYHKVMQFIPFDLRGTDEVIHFLNSMAGLENNEACDRCGCYGIISSNERAELNENMFAAFLDTELCGRMLKAERQGRLFREQQFMLGIEACMIDPDRYRGRSELIPVQGIIDCMFEEDDGMVILDYKTDIVDADEADELVKRYHRQLELYAQAASRILNKDVKEKILYSFALGKSIIL